MAEALRLAELFEIEADLESLYRQAAAELRRLHAENERLSATVKAREDEILTHSEAFYEATRLLSEEREKNERLAAALASSCDEQRHELWESGGVAGCERARVAERQRDALLGALKDMLLRDEKNTCRHEETHRGGAIWEICDSCGAMWADDEGGKPEWEEPKEWTQARAAIKAVEGEKT